MPSRTSRVVFLAVAWFAVAAPALAQRVVHWDRLDVSARLDADGALAITETHTMVFTGSWNGGERRFDIRSGQRLRLNGVFRYDQDTWKPLIEDSSLDDVDDYTWAGDQTLRWRSRRPTDPRFDRTSFRYELRYVLTGVVQRDGDSWRLNHDFAFPGRDGPIDRFSLQLSFDRAWRPPADAPREFTASGIASGRGFVVNLPLEYAGSSELLPLAGGPRKEVRAAVQALLTLTGLAVLWFFVREERLGRFAPLARDIDEAWIRAHILCYPAEVVGGAWDDDVGSPEVVALIARLVAEGKLESQVSDGGAVASMQLKLKVDRATLAGHERTLVDRLFFDGRTETSTDAVKAHYREEGFDPAKEIRDELQARVEEILPPGKAPGGFRFVTLLLLALGVALLIWSAWTDRIGAPRLALWGIGAVVLAIAGLISGVVFRGSINWGRAAALACLLPALGIAALAASYLWYFADSSVRELPLTTLAAIAALAFALTNASINALKSRQHRAAIAFRKTLAAGRAYFAAQLEEDRPSLRDEWYPWILALALGDHADAWSANRASTPGRQLWRHDHERTWSSSTTTSESAPAWTGFGGGRSGGAGGGASWAAAAGGMAGGVRAVSASSSSDGSSSSSSSSSYSSSDSGSSSSGGGGGGGW